MTTGSALAPTKRPDASALIRCTVETPTPKRSARLRMPGRPGVARAFLLRLSMSSANRGPPTCLPCALARARPARTRCLNSPSTMWGRLVTLPCRFLCIARIRGRPPPAQRRAVRIFRGHSCIVPLYVSSARPFLQDFIASTAFRAASLSAAISIFSVPRGLPRSSSHQGYAKRDWLAPSGRAVPPIRERLCFTRLTPMERYIAYVLRTGNPGIPFLFFIFYATDGVSGPFADATVGPVLL